MVIIIYGLQIIFIMSVYWYCSSLVISVIVLGVWATANRGKILINFVEGTETSYNSSSSKSGDTYSKKYVDHPSGLDENKTVYFNKGGQKSRVEPDPSRFGPKMVNPNAGNDESASSSSKFVSLTFLLKCKTQF